MAHTATAGSFTSDDNNPRSARAGSMRMKEIARENEMNIKTIVAGLLDSIGRSPTEADRIAAEVIASTAVRARRLRENGKSDALERRALPALLRSWPPSSQPRPEPEH